MWRHRHGLADGANYATIAVGDAGSHGSGVEQKLGARIVAGVDYEPVGGNHCERICRPNTRSNCIDFDPRVHPDEGVTCRVDLGAADIRRAE